LMSDDGLSGWLTILPSGQRRGHGQWPGQQARCWS
jgi:hypothetical protein